MKHHSFLFYIASILSSYGHSVGYSANLVSIWTVSSDSFIQLQ